MKRGQKVTPGGDSTKVHSSAVLGAGHVKSGDGAGPDGGVEATGDGAGPDGGVSDSPVETRRGWPG